MSIAANLGLIVFSIALLLGVIGAVKLAAPRLGIGAELQRKIVHVATGLYALTLPLTFSDRWPVVALVALSLVVMTALRFSRLGSALHSVKRTSHGEMYLALAVGFVFLRSGQQPVLFVLPVLVLTLADAAAALVGTRYGRKLFPVEDGFKSVEGVVAFFIVTVLISLMALLLFTEVPRAQVILLSLMIGAFGALVEADSWKGLDNLFVPVGIQLMLETHLASPLPKLAALALLFTGAMLLMLQAAPRLGLSRHAARSATVLVFLVCAVTDVHNALTPVFAIFAHIAARLARPDHSPHPDLDFLAMAAATSIFWLWLGEYFDRTAINLFVLTFAGVAAGLLALVFRGGRIWLLPLAVAALALMTYAVGSLNPVQSRWHGGLAPLVALSLALAVAAPLARPGWFDRYRYPRLFLGAVLVPFAIYLTKVVIA